MKKTITFTSLAIFLILIVGVVMYFGLVGQSVTGFNSYGGTDNVQVELKQETNLYYLYDYKINIKDPKGINFAQETDEIFFSLPPLDAPKNIPSDAQLNKYFKANEVTISFQTIDGEYMVKEKSAECSLLPVIEGSNSGGTYKNPAGLSCKFDLKFEDKEKIYGVSSATAVVPIYKEGYEQPKVIELGTKTEEITQNDIDLVGKRIDDGLTDVSAIAKATGFSEEKVQFILDNKNSLNINKYLIWALVGVLALVVLIFMIFWAIKVVRK